MKQTLTAMLLLLVAVVAQAQEGKKWGLNFQLGGITLHHNDEKCWQNGEDEGDAFDVSLDYYLCKHVALNAGVYAERQGLFTKHSNQIGLMQHWVSGVHAGAKYYVFNPKYIVQPYIGGNLYTNVLNLPKQTGSKPFSSAVYPGNSGMLDYEIQHAVASAGPQIGVEIRVLGSMSLTMAYDYRWEFYGHSDGIIHLSGGSHSGQTDTQLNDNARGVASIGLKMDFPARKVSERGRNNLMFLLLSLLSR